ncbi:MAG: hypothetical protein ABSH28_03460, partial [Acidobacteriota bacterium]
PGVLFTINSMAGTEIISFGPFRHNPEVGGVLGLIISLIIVAIGLLMLWSGKHRWRGFCFITVLIIQEVRGIFSRLIPSKANPLKT